MLQISLEEVFVWQSLQAYPEASLAYVGAEAPLSRKPIRNSEVPDLFPEDFSAKSVLAVELQDDGFIKFLFHKNPDEKLPIASISKLMAADIILENLDLMQSIEVTRGAVAQEEDAGQLKAGEILLAHDLLYIALTESSNDAVFALAEQIGTENFVGLMQDKAKILGMENTLFINPTGVDPDSQDQPYNYSTAADLIKLTRNLLAEKPNIWEILNTDTIDLYRPDGEFHHTLVNTNKLLGEIPGLVGGKTGWTPLAKESLLLVQENLKQDGFLVYVILGSDDRFGEMKRLVEWVKEAWRW